MTFSLDKPVPARLISQVSVIKAKIGGHDETTGELDCAHFCRYLHALTGRIYHLPVITDPFWFRRTPGLLFDHFTLVKKWQAVTIARGLDLVILAWRSKAGDHPAVYLGDGRLIHLCADGVHCESVQMWVGKIVAVFRPPLPEPC